MYEIVTFVHSSTSHERNETATVKNSINSFDFYEVKETAQRLFHSNDQDEDNDNKVNKTILCFGKFLHYLLNVLQYFKIGFI